MALQPFSSNFLEEYAKATLSFPTSSSLYRKYWLSILETTEPSLIVYIDDDLRETQTPNLNIAIIDCIKL